LKNNKQRGQLCILVVKREKRKKKHKQSITGGNPTIIRPHAPHHVEERMIAHPRRRWMTKFGHRVTSHAPPEWRGRHPLAGACRTHANNFSIKNKK